MLIGWICSDVFQQDTKRIRIGLFVIDKFQVNKNYKHLNLSRCYISPLDNLYTKIAPSMIDMNQLHNFDRKKVLSRY